jgi:two-component system chemotaxis response regulator CheB
LSLKEKILVVEDEITNTILMKRLLIKAGYDVTIAFNGEEAVQEMEKDTYDAVLTDWMMPLMDGIELIRRIRENTKPLPYIMMVTALVSEGAKTHALDSGADDYIAKPIDVNELLTRLKDGLQKKAGKLSESTITIDDLKSDAKPTHIGVAIATSTGGPPTIIKLFQKLDPSLNASFFLVQHGPPWMLETFSLRLDNETNFKVLLGASTQISKKGNVYVAPGDRHMILGNSNFGLKLTDGPKENFVRPAADTLFRSVAKYYGEHSVGVVLTGLGKDGTNGSLAIQKVGGSLFAQDPKDCIAPSMPTSIIEKASSIATGNIDQLAEKINKTVAELSSKL